jgi:hypothetical protein
MPKEKNQVLPYLSKVYEICRSITADCEQGLSIYDDGERRGNGLGKKIASRYLDSAITELEKLRRKFTTADPLKD